MFLLILGVSGTPLKSYKFRVFYPTEDAGPAAVGHVYGEAANVVRRRWTGGVLGIENP